VACWAHGAQADPPQQSPPSTEIWAGGEVFHGVWSLYTGASFAPFGSVQEDGLRLRAVGGYSDYGSGAVSFADLLVGYHAQFGPLTLKVFAGLTSTADVPDEPAAVPRGLELGGKGVAEAWWNVTDQLWTSADLSWASLHSVHGGRLRLGWRLWPELSSGLEGAMAGTVDRDVARVGGFVRYEWETGELSLSAGLAMDDPDGPWDAGPFATVSVLTRF
jgi:Cellulose biosynthesis protein BcsS